MRVRTGNITFTASAALAPHLRVSLNASGKLAAAGAEELEVGILPSRVLAADDPTAVVPLNVEGTVRLVAGEAISQYGKVYGFAGGKVGATANARFLGIALIAATADGDYIEVLPQPDIVELDAIDGALVLDDDFLGDYPAAATAFDNAQPWLKVETLGLGVTETGGANGALKFAFNAVAEAATAALYMPSLPFAVGGNPIFEARVAVFDKGDDAALDINIGLANGTHATDFDTITEYAAFHLNGADLSVNCQSDDGTTTVAATDTTVDLVDDTYANLKIDASDLTDVKFYINGMRVLASTTFDISQAAGPLTPIVHVEKTSNDTTADVRVDRIRVRCERG